MNQSDLDRVYAEYARSAKQNFRLMLRDKPLNPIVYVFKEILHITKRSQMYCMIDFSRAIGLLRLESLPLDVVSLQFNSF